MQKSTDITKDGDVFNFECPHCHLMVQVSQNAINCKIFRHGNYKDTFESIPPHASQLTCEELIREGKITGCGKPFLFDGTMVTKCDYI